MVFTYKNDSEEFARFWDSIHLTIPFIAQEECGELIQAVSKMCRAKLNGEEPPREHLIEEMADVFISISLLCNMFKITDEEVNEWINRKMERNIKRVRGE